MELMKQTKSSEDKKLSSAMVIYAYLFNCARNFSGRSPTTNQPATGTIGPITMPTQQTALTQGPVTQQTQVPGTQPTQGPVATVNFKYYW